MFTRALEEPLREALRDSPAVFVAGARQTGKSTLAQALARAERWAYRSFDDLATLASARADPEGFIASLGERTVLDEVQRVPEIFLPLKAAIDRGRRPGRFLLTGSADVLALPRIADSLAGRMEVLTLWPLSQAELEGVAPGFLDACFGARLGRLRVPAIARDDLLRRMLRGGYPEAVARGEAARARWFDAYLSTLLQRDVRDLAAIERIAELPRLLEAVAARTGAALNVADLGRTLGLNQMTLKRYLTLLATLYLLVPVAPWFENVGKRLAKAPKLHLSDAGLLAHVLGVDLAALLEGRTGAGAVVETFVVTEILKAAAVSGARPRLLHFRTSAGQEVDVVLENRRRELVGIEAKAGVTVGEADFRGLRALQGAAGKRLRCGVVLHAGREVLPFGPGLWAAPIQALWSPG